MSDLLSTSDKQLSIRRTSLHSSKTTAEHLQLGAALYIRQSTGTQLREHQESTARQYALQDRLVALGWARDQVVVIDEDLGVSGSGSVKRRGFARLLKLITDQQIGIVIGLEMSRLARNSKDWSDLFEVCAIFHTLIADEDGVFDPVDPNDRLVLGLKGIIAEMELHTMKVRLERGRMNKAARGELFHDVPVGYVLDARGLPIFDPDESARHVMKFFFELFDRLGSSHGLFHYLVEHNILLPFRENRRDLSGTIDWRLPSKTTVYREKDLHCWLALYVALTAADGFRPAILATVIQSIAVDGIARWQACPPVTVPFAVPRWMNSSNRKSWRQLGRLASS